MTTADQTEHVEPGPDDRAPGRPRDARIYRLSSVYSSRMAKHLIDIDEDRLLQARAELGTGTIKETVNEALRRATSGRGERVAAALDALAAAPRDDRADAWR